MYFSTNSSIRSLLSELNNWTVYIYLQPLLVPAGERAYSNELSISNAKFPPLNEIQLVARVK